MLNAVMLDVKILIAILDFIKIMSVVILCVKMQCRYAECHYALCRSTV
jgi:hypothetical protein